MTYTDVTWTQLFGGWILAVVLFVKLLWDLSWKVADDEAKEIMTNFYHAKTLSGRETADLVRPYMDECLKLESRLAGEMRLHNLDLQELSRANEKVISLTAQLSTMTDRYNSERLAKQIEHDYIDRLLKRPRAKNGRFERVKK